MPSKDDDLAELMRNPLGDPPMKLPVSDLDDSDMVLHESRPYYAAGGIDQFCGEQEADFAAGPIGGLPVIDNAEAKRRHKFAFTWAVQKMALHFNPFPGGKVLRDNDFALWRGEMFWRGM